MLGVHKLVFSDLIQGHFTHNSQIWGASHGPLLKPSKDNLKLQIFTIALKVPETNVCPLSGPSTYQALSLSSESTYFLIPHWRGKGDLPPTHLRAQLFLEIT